MAKTIRYTGTNSPTSCPSTQGGATTALVTQYLNYDMFGYPTDVLDPSGSETTSVYTNGQLTSQTVAGATTTYAYDSDKLGAWADGERVPVAGGRPRSAESIIAEGGL